MIYFSAGKNTFFYIVHNENNTLKNSFTEMFEKYIIIEFNNTN